MGWIGVDLDATLAHYDKWRGTTHIGPPVPAMVNRVKRWLREDKDVRIFTARASCQDGFEEVPESERLEVIEAIEAWCQEHIGQVLPITNVKDFAMDELYDDRAVAVLPNTGYTLNASRRGLDGPHDQPWLTDIALVKPEVAITVPPPRDQRSMGEGNPSFPPER